jgi:hypothetical protein
MPSASFGSFALVIPSFFLKPLVVCLPQSPSTLIPVEVVFAVVASSPANA